MFDFMQKSAMEIASYILDIYADESDCPLSPDLSFAENLPEKYITVHDWSPSGKQVKNWEPDRWSEVIEFIKNNFSLDVYQIGDSSSQEIPGAVSLLGKTTLRQSFGIISKSLLHLDVDSSMAHIATILNTPCISLWVPTSSISLGHKNQVKIISDYNCKNCWGYFFYISSDWSKKCSIGENAQCMKNISSDTVNNRIASVLNNNEKMFSGFYNRKRNIMISGQVLDASGYSSAMRQICVSMKRYGHNISIKHTDVDAQRPDVSRDVDYINDCMDKNIASELDLYVRNPSIGLPIFNKTVPSAIHFFWETSCPACRQGRQNCRKRAHLRCLLPVCHGRYGRERLYRDY